MKYDLNTLEQYKVNRPGQAEVVRQRLYDFQLYPTAGQTQFTFFSLPQGQGITSAIGAVVGTAKTIADTNMEIGGALPRPKSYLCESIEVIFEAGNSATANTFVQAPVAVALATAAVTSLVNLNDVNLLRVSGSLALFIGSKTYLQEAPLGTFPPKVRLELEGAIGNADTTTHNEISAMAAHWGGRPYYLNPEITLESLQNFSVTINFPAAVATTTNNGRLGVVFDGVLYRLSQ